jgi:hypothetical protein
MISWLIDGTIVAALVVTSWRTGRMVQELRRLRSEEATFGQALRDSDAAINRAAHAVVMLKSEGTRTLAALGERIEEGRRLVEELEDAARIAALELELANDNAFSATLEPAPAVLTAPALAAAPAHEAEWLRRLESRLAPASTSNR